MRLIFDIALKSILKGLQQLLLRSGMIARKTYCCGFLILRPAAQSLALLAILSSVLNR